MPKLIEKLWNWGHLEGSHNRCTGMDCRMTPEGFAEEYGIANAFLVSYGGNIQPPFDGLADRMKPLRNVCWSVLGDASTPLPEHPLGETENILRCAKTHNNIVGGIVDDFYAPKRLERFPPSVLLKIKERFNGAGMDFYAVLYELLIDKPDVPEFYNCVDVITYWIWEQEHIDELETHLEKFFRLFPEKRKMLGIYLWGYAEGMPMEPHRFQKQLQTYTKLLEDGKIEGIIFCSSCIGDAPLPTNLELKQFLAENADREI